MERESKDERDESPAGAGLESAFRIGYRQGYEAGSFRVFSLIVWAVAGFIAVRFLSKEFSRGE